MQQMIELHPKADALDVLGLGDLTRRYFVMIPREGSPRALTHRIEQHPFAHWPWETQQYSSWRELHAALPWLIGEAKRVGMEISASGAVSLANHSGRYVFIALRPVIS